MSDIIDQIFFFNIFILIFVRPKIVVLEKARLWQKKIIYLEDMLKKKKDRYKQNSLHHINLNKISRQSLARFKENYLLQIAAGKMAVTRQLAIDLFKWQSK